jgi:hypothetical protein
MKRIILMLTVAALMVAALTISSVSAFAAPLPSNCERVNGTVTCTTFEGPGNNQAGVGTTSTSQGQGSPDNTSPAPQKLHGGTSCSPDSSNGKPCNP